MGKSKRSNPEYTPKEAAFSIAITELYYAHRNISGQSYTRDAPPGYQKAAKKEIAKLHNRLLEESKMHGMALEVDEDEQVGV